MGTNYNFHHDNHHLVNDNLVNDNHYVDDDHGASHYVDIVNDDDSASYDDYRSADAYYLKHKYNVDLASPYNDQFHHDQYHHDHYRRTNDNSAPDDLFDNFYDEFNKHYNHDNDDDRTATAIDYVNNHDYDSPPDNYIDNFYDDFYFNNFHDGACDEHLVNKHHNYD